MTTMSVIEGGDAEVVQIGEEVTKVVNVIPEVIQVVQIIEEVSQSVEVTKKGDKGDQGIPGDDFELEMTRKPGMGSYMEYVLTGDKITQVNYWEDATKAIKLFTKDITYTGENPTTIITTDEVDGDVLTITIAYTGDTILNITKVLS